MNLPVEAVDEDDCAEFLDTPRDHARLVIGLAVVVEVSHVVGSDQVGSDDPCSECFR